MLVNWFCEVDEVFTVRIDGLAGIFVLEIGDGDRFGFLAVGFLWCRGGCELVMGFVSV